MINLAGETALVTGASRGIGRAIATRLLRAGAAVIGTATSADGAAAIGDELKALRAELGDAVTAEGVCGGELLDVSDADSIAPFFKHLASTYGAPSILVNNAGITRDSLLARLSEDDWAAVINTNLSSVYRLSRAALRPMLKQRRGRIISVTSVVGSQGNAGQTNYAASKAGIVGFCRALAREVGARNVTVNAVAPGFIDTDMTRALGDQQRQDLLGNIPLNRLGDSDDIAHAVAFLASPQAAYITGQTLHVNGGMYMG